jgi:hypothetical protein
VREHQHQSYVDKKEQKRGAETSNMKKKYIFESTAGIIHNTVGRYYSELVGMWFKQTGTWNILFILF